MIDDSIRNLTAEVRQFVTERGWLPFHKPRNIATALVKEAAELLELFQWDTGLPTAEIDEARRHEAASELADVAMYLLRFADECDIDLAVAVRTKLAVNRRRWPVDAAVQPDPISGRMARQGG
jgi:NTP pyrophosphatase (non-canonical NTP hydrolase)